MIVRKLAAALLGASALMLAGCASESGPTAMENDTPVTDTEIGATVNGLNVAALDPCAVDIDTPYWQDQGGGVAYQERCGRTPPGG